MHRTTQLTRTAPIRRVPKPLTAAENLAHLTAIERARTPEGYLQCERCGRSLLDREAQHHHIIYRSRGGPTRSGNLAILCRPCHDAVHGLEQPLHPDVAPPTLSSDDDVIYLIEKEDSAPDP